MKKMLTLLTVAMITASLTGCGCCRRLCPFLDRGAYCGSPAPLFAPLAATAPAPACQPYQYATPLAATAPATCCPAPTACCSSWDPCQGQVNYSYPPAGAAPCCSAPTSVAPLMYSGEAGCAYMDPSCGGPYLSGPVISSGCATCGTGYSAPVEAAPITVAPGPGE